MFKRLDSGELETVGSLGPACWRRRGVLLLVLACLASAIVVAAGNAGSFSSRKAPAGPQLPIAADFKQWKTCEGTFIGTNPTVSFDAAGWWNPKAIPSFPIECLITEVSGFSGGNFTLTLPYKCNGVVNPYQFNGGNFRISLRNGLLKNNGSFGNNVRPDAVTIFNFKGQMTGGITTKSGPTTFLWSPTKASGTAYADFTQNSKCELPDMPVHWTAHLDGGFYTPDPGIEGYLGSIEGSGVAQPANSSRG